jgi:DNA-binding MarR family transcriptional regulator
VTDTNADTTANDEQTPLARLFAMALRSMIDELHARLVDHGHSDLRPAFGFVLNRVRDGGATVVGIAELLGVTKQAASKIVDAMAEAGLVRRAPHGNDGRAKLVVLTDAGAEFLRTAESIYAEIEEEWAAIVGRAHVDTMRADLLKVLRATHDGKLPPIRPTW